MFGRHCNEITDDDCAFMNPRLPQIVIAKTARVPELKYFRDATV